MAVYGPPVPRCAFHVDPENLVSPIRVYDKEPKESSIVNLMAHLSSLHRAGRFDLYADVVLRTAISNPRLWLAVAFRQHNERRGYVSSSQRQRAVRITKFQKKRRNRHISEKRSLKPPAVIALPDGYLE